MTTKERLRRLWLRFKWFTKNHDPRYRKELKKAFTDSIEGQLKDNALDMAIEFDLALVKGVMSKYRYFHYANIMVKPSFHYDNEPKMEDHETQDIYEVRQKLFDAGIRWDKMTETELMQAMGDYQQKQRKKQD